MNVLCSRASRSRVCGAARVFCRRGQLRGAPLHVQHGGSRLFRSASCQLKEFESNPFFDKYRAKLERKQGPIKRKPVKPVPESPPAEDVNLPSHPMASYSYVKPPDLDSVMLVEKILDKSADEITEIWREYHKTRDCISAVMPAEAYVQLHTKATHCPYFLYPLPRGEGFEFYYSQFCEHRCFFTSLINYQTHQENAPVSLTLSHYTELQESKGIVLMAGEVDTKAMSTLEAQDLASLVQLYYATNSMERFTLVRQFNHDPKTFDYNSIIAQIQSSGVSLQ